MATIDLTTVRADVTADDESSLTELRSETLRTLVFAILAFGFVVVVWTVETLPPWRALEPTDPLPLLVGLAATAGLTHWTLGSGPLRATATMVAGLSITLTGEILLHSGSSLMLFFFLIVLTATGAGDWRAGFGAAISSTLIIFWMSTTLVGVAPTGVAELSLLAVWSTLLLAWLLARPLRATLDWSWSSYDLAKATTEEARLRQAELAQVSKSLTEACERLERVNVELHEARQAAELARRMKADFAATVGHELRTPVNLIIGFSQMMASPRRASYYAEPLPESYRSDIQSVYHNACHISSLVDDILDLSQIDAHRMALHKEPMVLAHVAEEAVANIAPLYAEAGLSLSIDVPPDLPRFPGDPVRIRQVLINLLYNAVRFTHQGGVVIRAHVTAGEAIVSVNDTGVGIPAADLGYLFEEFRQLQSPTRGHGGSGFGLAVCKQFVELHGGTIWAESEVDRGTTISFALPLHDNVAAVAFSSLPNPVAFGHREDAIVAVLDPFGETIRMIQRYLDGYQVREIKHFEQASQLTHRHELRAVVVTSSADEHKWQDYQRTHADVGAVPTLIFPLHSRDTIAKVLGITEYLPKPVSRDQLTRALRRLSRPIRNVVVIDDDTEMRSLLVRMVRSLHRTCRVTEAAEGATGLQLIRQVRPDAVLLDLVMPSTDGFSVIRALRDDEELRSTPVLAISARGPKEEVLVDLVGITRHDGLTVGEATAHLKASLDALQRPYRLPDVVRTTDGMAPVLSAGFPA